jgi:hypothetical protein
MKTSSAMLVASALSLVSMFALADDRTPSDVTPAEQAKMKKEADAKKSALAKMTPEERTAARKASDAEHRKYENTIEQITQNPGESRNMGINKSTAASKAGPRPARGTINTPEAEKLLLKQKGQ